ncbi:hypothetical protein JA1_000656 [Spathaspora sp. JA1]|nr:hypothetical protein JA1_000656 [Spathaspora sp. JA1]
MTLTSERFDIEFLTVNQLAATFTKLQSSPNKTIHQHESTEIAIHCLGLMDKYQALHPYYRDMIAYLKYYGVDSIYDLSWAREVDAKSRETTEFGRERIHDVTSTTTDALDAKDCHELFDVVKRCIITLFIQRNYSDADYYLNNYATVVQFSTQPKSPEQSRENRYLEYLFLQYSINIFQTIWFEEGKSSIPENKLVTSNSFKPLDTIFKKVSTYYSKNESLFVGEKTYDELHFYWIIKILHLYLLFKQFKFIEFFDEFTSLFIEYESKGTNLTPLQFFNNDNGAILKSNLLLMFAIVSIFLKPNCSLSFMNEDALIDLYNENESSLEFTFYNKVLIPLSKRDLVEVQETLHSDSVFLDRLVGYLDINFPVSVTFSDSFVEYMRTIIDFKNFLVIMSVTKQIPRTRVIELLGYDLSNIELINKVSNNLIVLVSVLGKTGIQYLASSELFIRENKNNSAIDLQQDLEDLNNDVKGMTLSSIMTSILIEKFYN